MYCLYGNSSWCTSTVVHYTVDVRYWECPLSEVPLYTFSSSSSYSSSLFFYYSYSSSYILFLFHHLLFLLSTLLPYILPPFLLYTPLPPPPPPSSPQDIITHQLPLREVVKALELVNSSKDSIKVVLHHDTD